MFEKDFHQYQYPLNAVCVYNAHALANIVQIFFGHSSVQFARPSLTPPKKGYLC